MYATIAHAASSVRHLSGVNGIAVPNASQYSAFALSKAVSIAVSEAVSKAKQGSK